MKTYKCNKCNLRSIYQSIIIRHYERVHRTENTKLKKTLINFIVTFTKYKCPCGKTLLNNKILLKHLETHSIKELLKYILLYYE